MSVIEAAQRQMSRPFTLGIITGLAAFFGYLPGSSRAFDYDGSVTVANFVFTPSLLDPFRRDVVLNNHPFFSFLEHLVYTASGSRSEVLMRMLPITAGAATVGLIVGWTAARFRPTVGLAAGAIRMVNDMLDQVEDRP